VFDLAASLSKPLSWKPHKGTLNKRASTAVMATSSKANKENSSASNPFVMPEPVKENAAVVSKPTASTAAPAAPFSFSFGTDISNTVASSSTAAPLASRKSFARGASQSRADIKTATVGANRLREAGQEARRANQQSHAQQARMKAAEAARRNRQQVDASMA